MQLSGILIEKKGIGNHSNRPTYMLVGQSWYMFRGRDFLWETRAKLCCG